MEFLTHLIDAPVANILVVAGLIFLGIGIVGKISGKIEPGKGGRIASALVGALLMIVGIAMHTTSHGGGESPPPAPNTSTGIPSNTQSKPIEQTPPPQKGFRVVETFLRADPFDHNGPCPVTIKFSGRISVVGGSGTVAYKFLRSDGASAPVESLVFDSPGSKDVSTTWTLGGAALPTFSGWQALQVLDPQETRSNEARFTIRCQ